jgi:hypothetical protein
MPERHCGWRIRDMRVVALGLRLLGLRGSASPSVKEYALDDVDDLVVGAANACARTGRGSIACVGPGISSPRTVLAAPAKPTPAPELHVLHGDVCFVRAGALECIDRKDLSTTVRGVEERAAYSVETAGCWTCRLAYNGDDRGALTRNSPVFQSVRDVWAAICPAHRRSWGGAGPPAEGAASAP